MPITFSNISPFRLLNNLPKSDSTKLFKAYSHWFKKIVSVYLQLPLL